MRLQTPPDSRQYIAFQHKSKIYELRVVPFELKTSAVALVRGLDHALRGIGNHTDSFVDDTLITSKLHTQHLEKLSRRLENNNLTLNLTKSSFLKKKFNS